MTEESKIMAAILMAISGISGWVAGTDSWTLATVEMERKEQVKRAARSITLLLLTVLLAWWSR